MTANPIEIIRRAAAIARDAGLIDEANDLESVTWEAYTTSSEMAGAFGGAIRAFVSRTSGRMPPATAALLDEAIADIHVIWPDL